MNAAIRGALERADAAHDRAMRHWDRSSALMVEGKAGEARAELRLAFEAGREAADAVAGRDVPELSRAVFHRSAASIAVRVGGVGRSTAAGGARVGDEPASRVRGAVAEGGRWQTRLARASRDSLERKPAFGESRRGFCRRYRRRSTIRTTSGSSEWVPRCFLQSSPSSKAKEGFGFGRSNASRATTGIGRVHGSRGEGALARVWPGERVPIDDRG